MATSGQPLADCWWSAELLGQRALFAGSLQDPGVRQGQAGAPGSAARAGGAQAQGAGGHSAGPALTPADLAGGRGRLRLAICPGHRCRSACWEPGLWLCLGICTRPSLAPRCPTGCPHTVTRAVPSTRGRILPLLHGAAAVLPHPTRPSSSSRSPGSCPDPQLDGTVWGWCGHPPGHEGVKEPGAGLWGRSSLSSPLHIWIQ